MPRLTFLAVVFLAACSGRVSTGSGSERGEAGAAQATLCDRDDFLGSYVVHFEQTGGDCGEPVDEIATYSDLNQFGSCRRLAPDAWSADSCTWTRSLLCDRVQFDTSVTMGADGSVFGTERRTIPGECTGSYDVTWTRR